MTPRRLIAYAAVMLVIGVILIFIGGVLSIGSISIYGDESSSATQLNVGVVLLIIGLVCFLGGVLLTLFAALMKILRLLRKSAS